ASGMNATYSIAAAGVEEFGLFANYAEPPDTTENWRRGGDYKSPPHLERLETGNGPTRPREKKARYTERQQGLRGLHLREFARNHYLTPRNLSGAVVKITNTLLCHLARCRGQTCVRDVCDELLWELKDYF